MNMDMESDNGVPNTMNVKPKMGKLIDADPFELGGTIITHL